MPGVFAGKEPRDLWVAFFHVGYPHRHPTPPCQVALEITCSGVGGRQKKPTYFEGHRKLRTLQIPY